MTNDEIMATLSTLKVEYISAALFNAVETFRRFTAEEPDSIFVSEQTSAAGERIVSSVWIISDTFVSEAKNLLDPETQTIDFMAYKSNVTYAEIGLASEHAPSSLALSLRFRGPAIGHLTASGDNIVNLIGLGQLMTRNIKVTGNSGPLIP